MPRRTRRRRRKPEASERREDGPIILADQKTLDELERLAGEDEGFHSEPKVMLDRRRMTPPFWENLTFSTGRTRTDRKKIALTASM